MFYLQLSLHASRCHLVAARFHLRACVIASPTSLRSTRHFRNIVKSMVETNSRKEPESSRLRLDEEKSGSAPNITLNCGTATVFRDVWWTAVFSLYSAFIVIWGIVVFSKSNWRNEEMYMSQSECFVRPRAGWSGVTCWAWACTAAALMVPKAQGLLTAFHSVLLSSNPQLLKCTTQSSESLSQSLLWPQKSMHCQRCTLFTDTPATTSLPRPSA